MGFLRAELTAPAEAGVLAGVDRRRRGGPDVDRGDERPDLPTARERARRPSYSAGRFSSLTAAAVDMYLTHPRSSSSRVLPLADGATGPAVGARFEVVNQVSGHGVEEPPW